MVNIKLAYKCIPLASTCAVKTQEENYPIIFHNLVHWGYNKKTNKIETTSLIAEILILHKQIKFKLWTNLCTL